MKIAIIGGGLTGLSAAYQLTKKGHAVTIFEKEKYLGGLAYGFRKPEWKWHLEAAYHHLFTNDTVILNLIKELGLQKNLIITRPITATLYKDKQYQLDSALSLFHFPALSIVDKFRTAILLGILKINPFWKPLESITAEQLCISIGGKNAFNTIWKPLLYGKFSHFAPTISAAWLWARIKKRTPRLYYIKGGFHTIVTALEHAITKNKGVILTSTTIMSIKKSIQRSGIRLHQTNLQITLDNNTHSSFDKVLLTIPTSLAAKIVPNLSFAIGHLPLQIPHLHAQVLILETNKPILDKTYWLNVTDESFPFLAVVAHTNFMDKKHYGGHHLTYIGNYLPNNHPFLKLTKEQLIKKFLPYIKRLSPAFRQLSIVNCHLFVAPFAQPVHQRHYSQKIPAIKTSVQNVYLANMDSIVPWDRGTNYAVELGINAANIILSSRA